MRKYHKQYYERNKEQIKQRTAKWQKENRKKVREYHRKYREKNQKELRKYHTEHKRKIKAKLVAFMGGKCENPECGYSKCLSALEIHHVDFNEKETESFPRSWKAMRRILKLWKEGKVKLLCANCHREEHEKLIKTKSDRRTKK